MILSNAPLQEQFAALQVVEGSSPLPPTNGTKHSKDLPRTYVIESLLGLVLSSAPADLQDTRSAACDLIKAYFYGHRRVKHHFLQRAIAGFVDGENERTNVLSTLMAGPHATGPIDSLCYTLAADILSQLILDDEEAKGMLMAVSEGNADKGEDVITATQTLAGHLAACLQNDVEPRVSIAFLNLLIVYLYDAQAVVNDCLAEGSSLLNALIETASQSRNSQVAVDPIKSLLPGLCAALLGVIYEFSSKDSPIPRRTLQPFLVNRLGRQRYFDALKQLRQHPLIRDAEFADEIAPGSDTESALFDTTFVDWYKDEYGRLKRAIDKDPGIEVIPRAEAGVDRDVLDDLRTQLSSKDEALQRIEQEGLSARQQADQLSADHRKELQSLQSSQRSMESEVERIKKVNDALQRDHESEIQKLQNDMNNELERVHNSHKVSSTTTQQKHEREVERLKGQHGANLASERSLWEEKARKSSEHAVRESKDKLDEVTTRLRACEGEIVVLKQDLQSTTAKLDQANQQLQDLRVTKDQVEKDLQRTTALQEGLQQVNTKAMSRVKALEEEGKQTASKVDAANAERDRAGSEIESLQSKVKDIQEELDGLKLELAAERKGYGELEAELEKAKMGSDSNKDGDLAISKLQQTVETKTAEADQEKEEAKKARTELEDMLMVMSDIEAKRDLYKERLQKLGEQVTDDEDDEDEDDEGDDVD